MKERFIEVSKDIIKENRLIELKYFENVDNNNKNI